MRTCCTQGTKTHIREIIVEKQGNLEAYRLSAMKDITLLKLIKLTGWMDKTHCEQKAHTAMGIHDKEQI